MNKKLLFTLINAYLFISTIIVTYITLAFGTVAGQVDTGTNYGWFYIVTFTVESNILLGLIAGVSCVVGARSLIKKSPLPKPIITLYLVATTSAVLTFLTVVLFLAPMRAASGRNYFDMLAGPMFFFHFFNPVVAALVLIFLTGKSTLTLKSRLLTLIPPALYAVLYITNVVILKNWDDFYHFTFGGRDYLVPVVFLVISAVVFALASALAFFHNKLTKKPLLKT